jgi:uncharacterized protein involved in outer membrane biogenesis
MFIPITVIFQDIDEEEAEITGKKPKKFTGELMVNVNNICGFNKNDNGNTNIRLANGEIHEAIIKYQEFKEILIDVTGDSDFLISGNN